MYFCKQDGTELYVGEMHIGDRKATTDEITQYESDLLTNQLKAGAKVELDLTDSVALRCWKANVLFPAEWQSYTYSLRAIYNGTDTVSETLPNRPSFPAGT